MTKVVFENATIRDSISKAAKIAPTKGSAFDKSAGILITVNPLQNEVIVRSTNTEVFYLEVVDCVSVEGDAVEWLIPSVPLDGITSKLPIASGAQVTFDQEGTQIKITHKRMVARMRLADPTYYPRWDAFDPTDLEPVNDFGARLQQVEWAVAKNGTPPTTGINLSGSHACATDNFKVAITPCELPAFGEGITIPANTLAPLAKAMGEVRIGRSEQELLVMPDESTQIRATIFAAAYPNVARAFKREETHSVMFKKDQMLEMISQAEAIGNRDRDPLLKLIIGENEFAIMMEDQELGILGNVIDLPGQAQHEYYYIGMNPSNFTAALRSAPNPDVALYYTLNMPKKPLRIDGGSGYEVLLMPRSLERSEQSA